MTNINMRNASIRNTVEPLYSGHHRDLKKMSATERCPLHSGFAQISTFTSNTAPKCIILCIISVLELLTFIIQSPWPYLNW